MAPGTAVVPGATGRGVRTISVSELTARRYANDLAGPGTGVIVWMGRHVLASTFAAGESRTVSSERRTVRLGPRTYRLAATPALPGFAGSQIRVLVLSDEAVTGLVAADRVLAAVFIVGFLVLAFFFSLLSSRTLQRQLSGFLEAARRLAGGDVSSPVPTAGHDEFALLGEEFNTMSRQLERCLEELEQERSRVRESIRRIGEAFASGLGPEALLDLALRTAMDATGAQQGRVSARASAAEPSARPATSVSSPACKSRFRRRSGTHWASERGPGRRPLRASTSGAST